MSVGYIHSTAKLSFSDVESDELHVALHIACTSWGDVRHYNKQCNNKRIETTRRTQRIRHTTIAHMLHMQPITLSYTSCIYNVICVRVAWRSQEVTHAQRSGYIAPSQSTVFVNNWKVPLAIVLRQAPLNPSSGSFEIIYFKHRSSLVLLITSERLLPFSWKRMERLPYLKEWSYPRTMAAQRHWPSVRWMLGDICISLKIFRVPR
jgi:hypothetical protein